MAVEKNASVGDGTAEAVSGLIAGLHETYDGARPREVRTYIDGHFVVCVIVEPFTSYEKQLLTDDADGLSMPQMWSLFEGAVAERFKGAVAEFTGKEVVCFLSQANADPDLVVVCFALAQANADTAT